MAFPPNKPMLVAQKLKSMYPIFMFRNNNKNPNRGLLFFLLKENFKKQFTGMQLYPQRINKL